MSALVPPKNLKLTTATVCNERKLIWLQNQDASINWAKWHGIVTSFDDFNKWSNLKARLVGIVITDVIGDVKDFLNQLYYISKKLPVVALSQKVFSVQPLEFWQKHFDNLINLDSIVEQYPFITNEWDGTNEDAIGILTQILRYNILIDCPQSDARKAELDSKNIRLESGIKPKDIWLITQFFKHKDYARFRELKECLAHSCANSVIDKIVLINEKDYSKDYGKMVGASKIEQVISGKRLTYSDFLKYVKENVPSDVFVILCNADIYFDNTLLELHKVNMNDKMLGLLRWDVEAVDKMESAKLFGPRNDSQDSWIFLSNSIKSREWNYNTFNFQLGQPGCDNVFAGYIMRQKFVISNPALSIKSYHLHNVGGRNYNVNDTIRSDIYIDMVPTYLIDSKQIIIPEGKPDIISNENVAFEVKSSSMSNEITYCTMLEKEGRYKWEASVENYYFQPQIPVYKWDNSSVTSNGLVYDLYTIYMGRYGNTNPKFNYWSEANVDVLRPQEKCDTMLAIPFKDDSVFKNADTYILNYISRCARLLKMHPEASFWIPNEFREYLDYFNWGDSEYKGIEYNGSTACYASKVVGFLPGPESIELGKEDIDALRCLLPSYSRVPVEKTCAIVLGSNITKEYAEGKLSTFLLGKDEEWSIRYVKENDYASYDSFIGASMCIFIGGKKTASRWSKLWALPEGCRVIEFQQELQIDGEFQHLAHVAGFKSWILLLAKGSMSDVQEQILEQLEKWFKKNVD
jgi:hypothetical protein